MKLNEYALEDFVYFVNEREFARTMKESNMPRPWTADPILHRHHFCNVHREDDSGTRVLKNLQVDLGIVPTDLPAFWTAARLFNYAPSVRAYWEGGIKALRQLQFHEQKIFNTAYVVSTCGARVNKVDYVHGIIWAVKHTPISPLSCAEAFRDLRRIPGLGSFLSGQIVADLKYTDYMSNRNNDFYTFAVMGPGSQKGLNLIYGAGTTERNFTTRLMLLRGEVEERVPKMHNQDLQNCLCEFSKYMRYKHNLPGRRRYYL